MANKKLINIISIIIICFFVFPAITFAASATSQTCWTTSSNGGLGLSNQTYYTKGLNSPRHTEWFAKYSVGGQRVFCVQPGEHFASNVTIDGYTAYTSAPSNVVYATQINNQNTDLNNVFSCWSENTEDIVATQAIVWELLTDERYAINANDILSGDYTPYQTNGAEYTVSGSSTLYKVITGISKVNSKYQAILRCAARFKVKPSFSYATDSSARNNAVKLSSYDDNTQTFSYTLNHSSSLASNLLDYYTVTSDDTRINIAKTGSSLKITTNSEILSNAPVQIKLTYTKKDDGTNLNNTAQSYYFLSDKQGFGIGSNSVTYYAYVYTGTKPKYQLQVSKVDIYNNPISGVTFDVYSDAQLTTKIGTTTKTNPSGIAYLTGITKVGNYYVKESSTPDGYVTNNNVKKIYVEGQNREGSNSYASASSSFVNYPMNLSLSKQTIDASGNVIDIEDYTSANCTGIYIGPKFIIKQGNKSIGVVEVSAGKYKLSTASTDTEVRTCAGKFNIEGITSGTYVISEIEAPVGYQLPSNPSQTVVVAKGNNTTATVMYNGVTGVVFNKVSEDGQLLDGGKYTLQQKVNGVYKDMLLIHNSGSIYSYAADITTDTENATYMLETANGVINVKLLPLGEYRFVEKEAPEGYEVILEKDSTATFTISDKSTEGQTDFYQVRLVNQAKKVTGSDDTAEFIVAIDTGRKVANYFLIFASLIAVLVVVLILRKKSKK